MKMMLLFVVLMFSVSVFAHSGGTDKYGCHHDKKTGLYHCH